MAKKKKHKGFAGIGGKKPKAKNFIKARMSAAPKRLAHFGLTSLGAVAGAGAINTTKTPFGKVSPTTRAMVGLGTALASSVLNPEEYSNSMLEGVGAASSIYLTAKYTKRPDIFGIDPAAVGLKKEGDKYVALSGAEGTNGTEGTGEINWQSEYEKAMSGAEDDNGTDGTDEMDGTNGAEDMYGTDEDDMSNVSVDEDGSVEYTDEDED